ncbi:MAG: hypothetical protein ACR2Q4_00175, partial [Geminicoccaceae bacterium]
AGVLALPAETAKEPMFAALVVEPKTVRSPRRPKKRMVTAKPGTHSTRPTPATSWPTSALPKTTSSARSMLPPTPIKPPWAYHWGLEKAKAHLQVLGAPEPDMPPFDESKHENLPEVEINPKDEHWVDPSVPLATLLDLD